MKTSVAWNFRPIVGKIMMGLALAVMIGSMEATPALGKDGGKHDNGRYEQRGRGYDHNRHVKSRRVYRHVYREPVYVEPRVIYAPPPPPGISIFFPPILIRP